MPESKEYIDQLQALALGCLEKTDLEKLRVYLTSGKDFPWQELGEYQNLVALLPAILNMEIPKPILKDKVARKLYRIRDESRAKKTTELNQSGAIEPTQSVPVKEFVTVSKGIEETQAEQAKFVRQDYTPEGSDKYLSEKDEPVQLVNAVPESEENFFDLQFGPAADQPKAEDITAPKNENTPDIKDYERVKSARKTSEFFIPEQGNSNQPEVQPVKNDSQEFFSGTFKQAEPLPVNESFIITAPEAEPRKNSSAFGIMIALLLLIIAGGAYAYLTITSEVKTYKSEVEKLNEEIKSMNPGASGRAGLQQMLDKPDTRIVYLSSIQQNTSEFGRVIINQREKKGFLQLGGLPLQTYQLWITINNKFVSLGVFDKTQDVEYFQFNLPDLEEGTENKFVLSHEPPGGSAKMGVNLFLNGSL